MSIEHEIFLNQLSQGFMHMKDGEEWFDGLNEKEQVETLQLLTHFITQARSVGGDVAEAIETSGLKATFTPCQLLLKPFREEPGGNRILKQCMAKVVTLPKDERLKSFTLLVHLFRVADKRKRGKGLEPDRYWWHRDLSNQEIVEQIILQYKAGNLMTDNE